MCRSWALLPLILLLVPNLMPESRNQFSTPLVIDHVTVCGSDLDAMRQAFARVGLRSDYAGPHAGSPTHMALLGFSDGSFVELIAPIDKGAPLPERSPWPKEIEGNAGPCGWAINVRQIEAQVTEFRGRGIQANTPVPGGRMRMDRVELQWETAALAFGEDSRLPFLIEDHTPRSWRAPTSTALKRTELTGVAIVVLGVRDLDASARLFQRAFALPAPVIQKETALDARIAYFPGTPVMLAAPLRDNSWLADRIQRFGERPAALLLGTRNFVTSSGRFRLSGAEQIGGHRVGWFNSSQLHGIRVGIVGD